MQISTTVLVFLYETPATTAATGQDELAVCSTERHLELSAAAAALGGLAFDTACTSGSMVGVTGPEVKICSGRS